MVVFVATVVTEPDAVNEFCPFCTKQYCELRSTEAELESTTEISKPIVASVVPEMSIPIAAVPESVVAAQGVSTMTDATLPEETAAGATKTSAALAGMDRVIKIEIAAAIES